MNDPALKTKEKRFRKNACLIYTACFLIISLFLVVLFWIAKKSFIHGGDAWLQHYKALVYYSDYLKTIVHNLFSGVRPVVPQWDFSLGLGSDIMTSLHYYAVGDPLNLLAVFVPKDKIYILFQVLIFLRSYLSGLFFLGYCRIMGHNTRLASVIGAITYSFGGYMLARSFKHPYFMNPMIYIPLIFIGIELILRKRSAVLLAVSVAISAMSNFYFFYMIVIITVVYVLLRLIFLYKTDIKRMLVPFLKIAAGSVVGVMIGSVILMPVITAFLGDGRRGNSGYYFGLFYSYKYYLRMIPGLVSSVPIGESAAFCFSCITFLCLVVLFMNRKKQTELKIAFAVGLIIHLFPALGYAMNGFAYVTNRWDFVFSFIVAYIVVVTVPLLQKVNKKQLLTLTVSFGVYVLICVAIKAAGGGRLGSFAVSAVLIAVILVLAGFTSGILRLKNRPAMTRKTFSAAVLAVCMLSIGANAFGIFSESGNDYLSEFVNASRLPGLEYDINESVSQASRNETGFFRYDGSGDFSTNSAVLYSQNGVGYYWSLSNPSVSDFRMDLNLGEYLTYGYQGFDDRIGFNALANVRYYYLNDQNSLRLPAGYTETSTEAVYENQNALNFGYTYDSYICRTDLKDCEPIDIERLMLSTAVTDTVLTGVDRYTGSLKSTLMNVPCRIEGSQAVQTHQNGFSFYKKDKEVTLNFDAKSGSETFLCFRGLTYTNTYDQPLETSEKKVRSKDNKDNEIYFLGYKGDELVFQKKLRVPTDKYYWYSGRTDFDICLGSHADEFTSFKIRSSQTGTITYDSMTIVCRRIGGYQKKTAALNEDTLENVTITTNCVSGDLTVEEPKLLCLSVPYSKGWTMYIDGEKTEPIRVNYMYIGAQIPEGSHEIVIRYTTPGLKIGALVSLFGTAALIGWVAAGKYIKKKKRKN